jgi:molybdopterin molybdotransferase
MHGAAPLAAAWAWLDAVPPGPPETVPTSAALGRVTAAPVASPADQPDRDRAARDGHAVRAAGTEGASAYAPIPLPAIPIVAGAALPAGTDAVLEPDGFDPQPGAALLSLAPGEGVVRQGEQLRRGDPAIPPGTRLRPDHIALLAELGIAAVPVRRTPRVRLRIAGPKAGADTLTPLLAGLLARDGAAASFAATDAADLIVFAGRSGLGPDDDAPAVLAAAGGRLDLHGIAIRPGGTSGLGWLGEVPVLLLPGEPLGCLGGYTLLAARLVRRLAGLNWPPGRPIVATLRRKIVSAIGVTDLARVSLHGDEATPLGPPEDGGLAGAARADGFVVVPEASEGYAAGSLVTVHPFDPEAGR